MKNRCCIFLNGTMNEKDSLISKNYIKPDDFIIGVDGGIKYLEKLNIIPNLFLGDFDSYDFKKTKKFKNAKIHKFPSKKDMTDGELAIDYVIENKFEEVFIFGALGKRIDHTFLNIYMLEKLMNNSIDGKIISFNQTIEIINGSIAFRAERFKYFSIIPISEKLEGVFIDGGKYPLNNASFRRVDTVGISNEFKEELVKIKIRDGKALLIKSKEF